MTENLKRCPFCGGEAKCIEYYGLYHVVCCDCYATGRDCPSIETACKAWNNRQIENELVEKIEELEAEIKRLYGALEEIKHTVTSAQSPVCLFHFDLDSKDGAFILETAENALKGIK